MEAAPAHAFGPTQTLLVLGTVKACVAGFLVLLGFVAGSALSASHRVHACARAGVAGDCSPAAASPVRPCSPLPTADAPARVQSVPSCQEATR